MGGAQPLAVTMNDGVMICVEVDPARIRRRRDTGYLDAVAEDLAAAIAQAREAAAGKKPLSIGLLGNAAEVLPRMVAPGSFPTSSPTRPAPTTSWAATCPHGMTLEAALALRASDPRRYARRPWTPWRVHCRAILDMKARGAVAFDYGNNLRGQALKRGVTNAFDYPGFVPAYIRPLFCEGEGPFRWAALSGDPRGHRGDRRGAAGGVPAQDAHGALAAHGGERVKHMGLPARICWLGYGERDRAGKIFNDLVRIGHG